MGKKQIRKQPIPTKIDFSRCKNEYISASNDVSNHTSPDVIHVRNKNKTMAETGVSHGRIITDSYQEDIRVTSGTIHCVPAPNFLMERGLPSG